MVRILIVEDSRCFSESLKKILDNEFSSNIMVEEAKNGEEGMKKADSLHPDFIFMDIRLPDISGLQLTKKIKAKYPNVCIVILSSCDGPAYQEAALCYGASGYLVKGESSIEEIQGVVKSFISKNHELKLQK